MNLDRLVKSGIAEDVAFKITLRSKEQSETLQRLQLILEGLKRYRAEFQVQRRARFMLDPKSRESSKEKLNPPKKGSSSMSKEVKTPSLD